MPKLNALHNHICRDCGYLDYYDGYLCGNENLPEEFWSKYLFRGIYIPENKDFNTCPYFIPRKTCVPSKEVKECQFWCTANHHGNLKDCPLLEIHSKNI